MSKHNLRTTFYAGCIAEVFMNGESKGYIKVERTPYDDVTEICPWMSTLAGAAIFFNDEGQVGADAAEKFSVRKKIVEDPEMYASYCHICRDLKPTDSYYAVARAVRKFMKPEVKLDHKYRDLRHFQLNALLDQHSRFEQEWAM